jgi:hypothetical protein
MTAYIYDPGAEAALTGSGGFCPQLNSGTIKIYTGSQPAVNGAITGTLLATLTFSSTAFANATATGGVASATANTITSGTAGNTGTAGYFALVSSGSVVIATGTCGTSGADLNLNTTSVVSGNTVSITSFVVSLPET